MYYLSRKHRGSREEKNDSPEQKRITSVDPGVSDKSSVWSAKKEREGEKKIRRKRTEEEKKWKSLQFPRHEAGQQKHSGQINFYAGRFSRQPFDNLQVASQRRSSTQRWRWAAWSGRQVPREACVSLPLQPLLLLPFQPHPFLCRPPVRNREKGNARERGKIETSVEVEGREREREREREEYRILLRRTLALATGALAIYFPGFQSPKPLISAPQRQWSASGRRRGAWRRRRRSALSRSLVYSAVAACCCCCCCCCCCYGE